MRKWFVEIVKDNFNGGGKYHANMMIDGKAVEGLVRDVDYNTLRADIKAKTGIEILKRKDMVFWWHNGDEFAILDYTRNREDSRVSCQEAKYAGQNCWRPDFEGDSSCVGKQVVIGPFDWGADGFDGMFVDVGTVMKHCPKIVSESCGWAGSFTVQKTERLYLDGRSVELDDTNDFMDTLALYSGNAREVAEARLLALRDEVDILLAMPVTQEPDYTRRNTGLFSAFFEVLDVNGCTDEQLVLADKIARAHKVGYGEIRGEMAKRFRRQVAERVLAEKPLAEKLTDAKERADRGNIEACVEREKGLSFR